MTQPTSYWSFDLEIDREGKLETPDKHYSFLDLGERFASTEAYSFHNCILLDSYFSIEIRVFLMDSDQKTVN